MFLLTTALIHATGGYDNGSAVGTGKLQLDLTLNPLDVVPYGQSYAVWNYGLSERTAFHGYVSHEAKDGTNQIYYGLKYTFLETSQIDLATAIGLRHREDEAYIYLPQLLYTYKLGSGYDIGGSILYVYNMTESDHLGMTYDAAFRIPFHFSWLDHYVQSSKLAIGVFRNASGRTYPTYSIDLKF